MSRYVLGDTGLVLLSLLLCQSAVGDEVVLRSQTGSGTGAVLRGEVLDLTGGGLTIKLTSGQTMQYDRRQVAKLHVDPTPQQVRGEALMADGEFAAALEVFRAAANQEPEAWMRREMLTEMVWCLRYLDRWQAAADTFLAIVESDPTTLAWEAAPLAWDRPSLTPTEEQQARTWLTSGSAPQKLLAASVLLQGATRAQAVAVLSELAGSDDINLAWLAQMQLWRSQIATADVRDLTRWENALLDAPDYLRGGGYWVAAKGWALRREPERAVAAYLRLPILYPKQRHLASEALWEAGGILEKLGQRSSARRLYDELARDYPESRFADSARAKLAERESTTEDAP